MRMNRDNRSVWSGRGFSSCLLQVYFLPTLQRKRKKEKVDVNHETATRTNIRIYLELSHPATGNRPLSPLSSPSVVCHQILLGFISPTLSGQRRPQKTIRPTPEPGRWANESHSHDHSSLSRVSNQLTATTTTERNSTLE